MTFKVFILQTKIVKAFASLSFKPQGGFFFPPLCNDGLPAVVHYIIKSQQKTLRAQTLQNEEKISLCKYLEWISFLEGSKHCAASEVARFVLEHCRFVGSYLQTYYVLASSPLSVE